jgi:hypothetical protein
MPRTYDPKLVENAVSNKDIQRHLGFMPDQVAGRIRAWLG